MAWTSPLPRICENKSLFLLSYHKLLQKAASMADAEPGRDRLEGKIRKEPQALYEVSSWGSIPTKKTKVGRRICLTLIGKPLTFDWALTDFYQHRKGSIPCCISRCCMFFKRQLCFRKWAQLLFLAAPHLQMLSFFPQHHWKPLVPFRNGAHMIDLPLFLCAPVIFNNFWSYHQLTHDSGEVLCVFSFFFPPRVKNEDYYF